MLDAFPIEDFIAELRSQRRLHLDFQIVERVEILGSESMGDKGNVDLDAFRRLS